MTMRDFIKANRAEIDTYIGQKGTVSYGTVQNDTERRLWVLNDETLYRWARSAGVNV